MAVWIKRLLALLVVAAIGLALWLAMRPRPVAVDLATVVLAPMSVEVEEEGVARVREVYTVSAPIAGHLDRTTLEEGETVKAGETVIASIHPLDPPFLDERTIAELNAAREAARSAIALAEVDRTRAQMAYNLAKSEFERAKRLAGSSVISESQLERTSSEMQLKEAEVASADAAIRQRHAELESVEAKLSQPRNVERSGLDADCCVRVRSPIDGVVLSIEARSEQAVTQGARIAEIGDTSKLEVAVDLLSTDAPRVRPGTRAVITGWGGSPDIPGHVRRVEPSAFTKTSALGIEEQRVNAIIDLDTVPASLGHGYRVIARIEVWSADNALQLPLGGLFRIGRDWAVYAAKDGYASLARVEVGEMNGETAQILSGLAEGMRVILYPSDLVEDGTMIVER